MMRPFSSSARSRRAWMLVAHLVLQGSVAYSGPARAETANASRQEAEGFVRRGLELRRARRDAEALSAFQQAFAKDPTPMVRAQIALAEQALGQWIAADRDLSATLDSPDAWVQAHRAVLEKALAVIRSHLGVLEVVTNEPNLEFSLDDESFGPLTSEPKRLLPGRHRLRLRRPNGERREFELSLAAEQRLTYHLEWSPTGAALAPSRSSDALPSPDRPERETTAHEAGSTSKPDAAAADAAKKRRAQTGEGASKSSIRTSVGYIAAGVALAALTEGVVASLVRQKYVERYNGPECYPVRSTQCSSQRDIANDLERVAFVSYLVAGAAGASSLALFAWPLLGGPPSQGSKASKPSLSAGAQLSISAQLVVSGQF